MHKITDVPDNMRFVDVNEVEEFFEAFKDEEINLDTFKHNMLLPRWKEYLDGIVNKLKENYIEG
ncbi:hypothetical protein C6576_14155 [Mammaliicoccus sciuri]|nr:hypothetical protein C6576_14155 [Mammaliicoccus sciuri]